MPVFVRPTEASGQSFLLPNIPNVYDSQVAAYRHEKYELISHDIDCPMQGTFALYYLAIQTCHTSICLPLSIARTLLQAHQRL